MEQADERDLLIRAQQGNQAAFGEVVRRQQTAVFNVAYRLLGRRRDAEDATQEAFLRAYRALERFDVNRPFAPWIKRITTNLCYNWLSSERVKPTVSAADLDNDNEAWAKTAHTPEQQMVHQEQSDAVREAIWQLSPRYRAVIELRHFQNLSYEEMADVLDRPLSSIKSDLFRARKQLSHQLKGRV